METFITFKPWRYVFARVPACLQNWHTAEKILLEFYDKLLFANSSQILIICLRCEVGTITSKINVTPKDVYLPISNLHSILTVAILLAHNNRTIIYNVQENSLQLK